MNIELKTSESLNGDDEINYLRATNIEVGLLLTFGRNKDRRKACDNKKKFRCTTRIRKIE